MCNVFSGHLPAKLMSCRCCHRDNCHSGQLSLWENDTYVQNIMCVIIESIVRSYCLYIIHQDNVAELENIVPDNVRH
jgi:hypothetical protein